MGSARGESLVSFEPKEGSLQIKVDGKPLATYVWQDRDVMRPYFAHVHAPNGKQVTRNNPPIDGIDATDHASMHLGLWLAFGDLGGEDFWRNKGQVNHVEFVQKPTSTHQGGSFTVRNRYVASNKTICEDWLTMLPWVGVSKDNKGFVLQPSMQPFVPWGFNYDHDENGRLIEDYWLDEWPKIEGDFAEMKQLGANVVRIHLQLGKFMDGIDKPNEQALDQADRPRPDIARRWVDHLVASIRKTDKRHLVTVGLVDWSLDRKGLTSGFVPEKVTENLDFVAVHLYPETGKLDEAAKTLDGFSVGKPVVVEEMFPLKCSPKDLDAFIEKSGKDAAGWISFYWGEAPDELRRSTEIGDAILLQWLELFEKRAEATHSDLGE